MLLLISLIILLACKPWRFFSRFRSSRFSSTFKVPSFLLLYLSISLRSLPKMINREFWSPMTCVTRLAGSCLSPGLIWANLFPCDCRRFLGLCLRLNNLIWLFGNENVLLSFHCWGSFVAHGLIDSFSVMISVPPRFAQNLFTGKSQWQFPCLIELWIEILPRSRASSLCSNCWCGLRQTLEVGNSCYSTCEPDDSFRHLVFGPCSFMQY